MGRTLHIGIVGRSADGAALCYRTICTEGERYLGPHGHPEVSMHTVSFADHVACLDRVAPRSPRPWLHIAEIVAAEARERGFPRVGLTGTKWLVSSDVYPSALERQGIECVRPPGAPSRS